MSAWKPGPAIRWGAWGDECEVRLPVRNDWTVTTLALEQADPLADEVVRERVEAGVRGMVADHPISDETRIVIGFDDLSRPTPTRRIVEPLVRALLDRGANPKRITLIAAVGGHRPLSRDEFVEKLGESVVADHLTLNHHPFENLVDLGTSSRGTPIHLNRDFVESDLRILVGCVLPHPYMGFGGGAKMVLPGLSGIDSLESNHRSILRGLSGGLLRLEDNDARADVEEIATRLGVHLSLQAVCGPDRALVALEVGEVVASHRRAAACAESLYRIDAPDRDYDLVVLGAYPKDREQYQLGNVFNALRSAGREMVRPGGTVLIVGRCSDGVGYHALQGHGMRLHRKPVRRSMFEDGREIALYAPGLNPAGVAFSFHEGTLLAQDEKSLEALLGARHGGPSDVLVVPSGPLSILRVVSGAEVG